MTAPYTYSFYILMTANGGQTHFTPLLTANVHVQTCPTDVTEGTFDSIQTKDVIDTADDSGTVSFVFENYQLTNADCTFTLSQRKNIQYYFHTV